jgi:hypothetical protein
MSEMAGLKAFGSAFGGQFDSLLSIFSLSRKLLALHFRHVLKSQIEISYAYYFSHILFGLIFPFGEQFRQSAPWS